ncbi:MAG: DUF1565 domain-containing protein [Calothrix sp. SM1_7_51]|nr:DUF1565 domain-containing protein [Calothrix sp. SM1_7_51]
MSQVNVLFVNPSVGDDTAGNGSERTPLKTITQALRVAQTNTVISLAKGTYSAQTGEQFPLILKPGVSIQGETRSKGRGVIIQGGGDYLSRSYGSQNIAIIATNQSGLTGVTVTNNNNRGYGVWIESVSPTITENIFAGSTQDGILITGESTAAVNKNFFIRNNANGITIAGNSRPNIGENIFQQTGFGINIAQNAAPTIVANQIQYNRSGIVVQANARPVLRNNLIQGNREDGLVVIAQAMPDLGNANEPGGNDFRNNGKNDINASASKQIISAFGNSIPSNRIAGQVDIKGTSAVINATPISATPASTVRRNSINRVSTPVASVPNPETNLDREMGREISQEIGREITFSAPGVSDSTSRSSVPFAGSNNTPRPINQQLVPLQPASIAPLPPRNQQQTDQKNAFGFPTPSSLDNKTQTMPSINYVQMSPPNQTNDFNRTPQIGNTSNPNLRPPAIAMGITQSVSRFRVMVEVKSNRDLEFVRFIVPGAFTTNNNQSSGVVQAGVFSSRFNADELVKIFNTNGLRAMVEPLN